MTYPVRQALPDAPEYSDEKLLAMARAAMAQIMTTGQDAYLGSRRMTQADLPELRKMVDWLESRIDTEAGTGLVFNLVQRVR